MKDHPPAEFVAAQLAVTLSIAIVTIEQLETQNAQLRHLLGRHMFGAGDPIDAAVDAQLGALGDAVKAQARRWTPDHHVWREKHGDTCVCGAKKGDPEPCPGPAIIGRD